MRIAALIFSFLLVSLSPALAKDYLIVKPSQHSAKDTLNRLEKILLAKGIKIAGRISHSENAKTVDVKMPDTEVLIFGNPKLGTPLIQANPQIGAVLPMKILVWTAENGKVFVGYVSPEKLRENFGIQGKDAVFKTMTNALDAITNKATAK